ncbi:hypothetical protein BC629DRAFT_1568409 [Irpex lacteus]|nr:hypothetical protein BC629DRAFT_1568409 [Irpex lacteus]
MDSFATQLIQHSSFLAMRPLCLAYEEMHESYKSDEWNPRCESCDNTLFSLHYLRLRDVL